MPMKDGTGPAETGRGRRRCGGRRRNCRRFTAGWKRCGKLAAKAPDA